MQLASILALARKCDVTMAAQATTTTTTIATASEDEDTTLGAPATSLTPSSKESSSSLFQQTCVYLIAFSSRTGFSEPVGYFWKVCFINWLGWSLWSPILLATLLALACWMVYTMLVAQHMPPLLPQGHIVTSQVEKTTLVNKEEEDKEG